MINNFHINEFVTVELVDGILIGVFNSRSIDLNVARAAVTFRLKQYYDKDYPLLIHMEEVKHITKDAREYLASQEGCYKVASCAIITSSMVSKFLANFFLQINKPLVPTKLFTSEETAKEWLSTYVS